MKRLRHVMFVLGNQLDLDAVAFDGFDPEQCKLWMAEAWKKSTDVIQRGKVGANP